MEDGDWCPGMRRQSAEVRGGANIRSNPALQLSIMSHEHTSFRFVGTSDDHTLFFSLIHCDTMKDSDRFDLNLADTAKMNDLAGQDPSQNYLFRPNRSPLN